MLVVVHQHNKIRPLRFMELVWWSAQIKIFFKRSITFQQHAKVVWKFKENMRITKYLMYWKYWRFHDEIFGVWKMKNNHVKKKCKNHFINVWTKLMKSKPSKLIQYEISFVELINSVHGIIFLTEQLEVELMILNFFFFENRNVSKFETLLSRSLQTYLWVPMLFSERFRDRHLQITVMSFDTSFPPGIEYCSMMSKSRDERLQ